MNDRISPYSSQLLTRSNASTSRYLGPGITKLEGMLKSLKRATSTTKSKSAETTPQRQRRNSAPSIHPPRLFDHSHLPPTQPTEPPIVQALSLIQNSRGKIDTQALLSWRPDTHALQRNLSPEQKAGLETAQLRAADAQARILENLERGLRSLVLVERVLTGFEAVMGEREWKGLESEQMFMVVEGLLMRILGGVRGCG